MEEQKVFDVPSKQLKNIYLNHFAIILSNISIFGFVVGAIAVLSSIFVPVVTVIMQIFLVFGVLLTLGAVFAIYPNYSSLFSNLSNFIDNFPFETLLKVGIGVISISIVFSILSIIFFCLNKQQKHSNRIAIMSAMLGLLVLILIFAILRVTGVIG